MRLKNGLFLGFMWVHDGGGYSSKTTALIAAFHHQKSITWRWKLEWLKPRRLFRLPSGKFYGIGFWWFALPLFGGLAFTYQGDMIART